MQLFYQFYGLLFFFIEGPLILLVLTLVGIAFTVTGAINHWSIFLEQKYAARGNEKYELTASQKKQYFWLNVTGIFMVTGLPTTSVNLLSLTSFERLSTDASIWIGCLCLNLPGIIYFVQAVSAGRSMGNKWQWPRYL